MSIRLAYKAIKLIGQWPIAKKIVKTMIGKLERAGERAIDQEAHRLRSIIVTGLRTQEPGGEAFKSLSPLTIAVRQFMGFKGKKALIRKGDMRNGIVVRIVKDGKNKARFIGILRTARSTTGKSLVNVAKLQEFGGGPFLVPITPKSSKFYHLALKRAGIIQPKRGFSLTSGHLNVAIVRIPARPFLRPSFEQYKKDQSWKSRVIMSIAKDMNGDFGKP